MVDAMTNQTSMHARQHTNANHFGRPRLADDKGFSLVELIVASLISMFVVGGLMTMLVSVDEINRDSQQRSIR